MEERREVVRALTSPDAEIVDVPKGERGALVPILQGSFEGLYLWHSKRTLRGVDHVRASKTLEGTFSGLIMLKMLAENAGYVYYVAVAPEFRRRGIAGRLLDSGLSYFQGEGVGEVYASVPAENEESKRLFASKGFARVEGSEMNEKYGRFRALLMYREMMLVRGEVLLGKRLQGAG